jgi:hypothetical protein
MALQYPLHLRFKLIALAPQVFITDASGQNLMFVRQKIFNLREDVRIFTDSSMTSEIYRIKADRIIDFSAKYKIFDSRTDQQLGYLQHKGMRSIWKSHYIVYDMNDQPRFEINEDNPWVKLLDALVGEIPIVGMFTGYLFSPSYTLQEPATGKDYMRLKKQPAFFESLFDIEKLDATLSPNDETLMLLSWLMAIQLERSRG